MQANSVAQVFQCPRKPDVGGAKRNENATPINNIQPRLERAASLETRTLPTGENRNAANTSAARTLPSTPARIPNTTATTRSTRLNARGTRDSQLCPDAMLEATRAAMAQSAAPMSESAFFRERNLPLCCRSIPEIILSDGGALLGWQNAGLLWEKSRVPERASSSATISHPRFQWRDTSDSVKVELGQRSVCISPIHSCSSCS